MNKELLSKYFHYENGDLFWKISPSNNVPAMSKILTKDVKGYGQVTLKGKNYKVHRIVYMMHFGTLPEQIDHIDGNPSNNLISNLRPATTLENNLNKRTRRDSLSGVKGVRWRPIRKKFESRIGVNGKSIHLGYFDFIEDATKAYAAGSKKYHREFGRVL